MIIINGQVWRISLVPPYHPILTQNFTAPALGCCDNFTKTIYINTAQPIEQVRRVICHEITHAYIYSNNIDMPIETAEMIADFCADYGKDIINSTLLVYNQNFVK